MSAGFGRNLARADALEATNLRHYQRQRRPQVRRESIGDFAFGALACLLQAAILLFTGGLRQPWIASAVPMALCFVTVLALIFGSLRTGR
ncbi:MAG: hypothetical protein M3072_01225 [Candidatus Dormibacteraeota bacterium]|nr:hypothetical protein [Candidatus Dormibacteraeota bacterium]